MDYGNPNLQVQDLESIPGDHDIASKQLLVDSDLAVGLGFGSQLKVGVILNGFPSVSGDHHTFHVFVGAFPPSLAALNGGGDVQHSKSWMRLRN